MTVRTRTYVSLGVALVVVLAATSVYGQGGAGRGGQNMAGAQQGQGGRGGGQAPLRDASGQPAVGTASISGIVVVDGAGTPVRRARVSVAAPELRGGRAVLTDDQGRFSFEALPAGRFTLTATKSGYVSGAYGAKRAGRPGTPIQLTDGQELTGLTVPMPRGGVITGIVVDEYGEPAPGTPVRALRYVMQTGERRLQQAGQDQADDRGMYRIFQLQPGEYIVNAVPRNQNESDIREFITTQISSLVQQAQAEGINVTALANAAGGGPAIAGRIGQLQQQLAEYESDRPTAYAPVYYPGTTTPESAVSVALGAGEERSGVDFRLQLVPTSRVSGLVVTPEGALPSGTQVALLPRSATIPLVPGIGRSMARVGGDGRFAFNNVTPGDYSLQARATVLEDGTVAPGFGRGRGGEPRQILWAATDVSVGGMPLPDVVLTLQTGMTVSGQVRFEGGNAPEDLSNIRVTLNPRGSETFNLGGISPAQTDASGRFTIQGVAPGAYSVTAMLGGGGGGRGRGGGRGAPLPGIASGSWTLKSALHEGRDLLDFPVEIGPNESLQNVQIIYSDQTQELTGTIQDTSGRPTADFTIIVFPTDTNYWVPQSRRITATRPGTDGQFSFRGLPPGQYGLTAVTDVEPGEWYDPAFLEQLSTASIPIRLAEGERKVQDIRVAGG